MSRYQQRKREYDKLLKRRTMQKEVLNKLEEELARKKLQVHEELRKQMSKNPNNTQKTINS